MSEFAIRPPDMSRNMALAGKTVSSKGRNITYDELGYAVKAVNYNSPRFAGMEKSIRAPSVEAVLAGAERARYGGSAVDQEHLSDRELSEVTDLRAQAESGRMASETANMYINEIRARYGYTGEDGVRAPSYAKSSVEPRAAQQPDEERMKESYQIQLRQQQEQQLLTSELKRTDSRAVALGLLETLEKEDEKDT